MSIERAQKKNYSLLAGFHDKSRDARAQTPVPEYLERGPQQHVEHWLLTEIRADAAQHPRRYVYEDAHSKCTSH